MIDVKHHIRATILLIPFMIYPHVSFAETFKSAQFLEWERESQDYYIHTSVGMAGLIAVKNDKTQQKCLEEWYFANESATNESILETMRKFPEYHPRGVIMALMEKHCGSFTYSER